MEKIIFFWNSWRREEKKTWPRQIRFVGLARVSACESEHAFISLNWTWLVKRSQRPIVAGSRPRDAQSDSNRSHAAETKTDCATFDENLFDDDFDDFDDFDTVAKSSPPIVSSWSYLAQSADCLPHPSHRLRSLRPRPLLLHRHPGGLDGRGASASMCHLIVRHPWRVTPNGPWSSWPRLRNDVGTCLTPFPKCVRDRRRRARRRADCNRPRLGWGQGRRDFWTWGPCSTRNWWRWVRGGSSRAMGIRGPPRPIPTAIHGFSAGKGTRILKEFPQAPSKSIVQ